MNAAGSTAPWLDEIRCAVVDAAGPGAIAEFQCTAEYAYQLYAGTWGEAWGQHAVRQTANAVLARSEALTNPEVETAQAAGHEAGRLREEEVIGAAYTRHADDVCQAWSERDAAFIAAHRGELKAAWPEGFAVAASLGDGSGQGVAFGDFPLIWSATAGFLGALHRPAQRAIAEQAIAQQAAAHCFPGRVQSGRTVPQPVGGNTTLPIKLAGGGCDVAGTSRSRTPKSSRNRPGDPGFCRDLERDMIRSVVYTLHLWPPVAHAKHYTGYVPREKRLPYRLADHALGRGARLTQVQVERGGSWVVAQTEPGGRRRERQLKKHGAARRCQVCLAIKGYQAGELSREQALARAGWDRASEHERALLLDMFGVGQAQAPPPAPSQFPEAPPAVLDSSCSGAIGREQADPGGSRVAIDGYARHVGPQVLAEESFPLGPAACLRPGNGAPVSSGHSAPSTARGLPGQSLRAAKGGRRQ